METTHDVLFLSMSYLIVLNIINKNLPVKLGLGLFIGALIPLGAFIADRFLKKHIQSA